MSINKFYNSFVQKRSTGELNETEDLDSLFNEYLTEKMAGLLVEDHEKSMTAEQMAAHIKKLFKMCDDEATESKFLKRLGKAADVEDCKEKDITTCAKKLCDMDDEKCDDMIHELEGMVDYTYESKKEKPEESDEKEKDKKKIDEGVSVGSVVKTMNGKHMVVIGDMGEGDVTAVRLHHGKPLYRTQINLRSSEYVPTGETVPVMSKKDLKDRENSIMDKRKDHVEYGHRTVGSFNF